MAFTAADLLNITRDLAGNADVDTLLREALMLAGGNPAVQVARPKVKAFAHYFDGDDAPNVRAEFNAAPAIEELRTMDGIDFSGGLTPALLKLIHAKSLQLGKVQKWPGEVTIEIDPDALTAYLHATEARNILV